MAVKKETRDKIIWGIVSIAAIAILFFVLWQFAGK